MFFCREIIKRFNISVSYLPKNNRDRLEARGFFATDIQTLKQNAFPLLNYGGFQNASYEQMLGFLASQLKKAANFTSLADFVSEFLTPEGFQLFNHLNAFIPNYSRQPNPETLSDLLITAASFKHNYSRPDKG